MTAAGSHKMKKPVLGTTSEHTLVWAAFMLFNSLPQRALCVHYCLYFKKVSYTYSDLAWCEYTEVSKWMAQFQCIFLSPSLIKLYLL